PTPGHPRSGAGKAGTSAPCRAPSSLRPVIPAPAPAKPAPPVLAGLRRAYARSYEQRVHARRPQRWRLLHHVALVPERERQQPPQLPAPILRASDVLVEQPRHGPRLEEALRAQCRGREGCAGEGLELAAQPGRGGNREAAFAPV